jgi:multidrug efflux pump subunit AcrA (membrane-fusion protein)
LAKKDGGTIVWVADRATSSVHARPVTVADFAPGGVHIAKGLQAGDLVVAAGTQFMSENLNVKLPDAATEQADALHAAEVTSALR